MKKKILVIITFIFFTNCVNSQNNRMLIKYTGIVEQDINKYLTDNSVVADIMDGIKQSPRYFELVKKFRRGIQENYEWFTKYVKKIPKGEPMPYHKNLGLTKKEYDELLVLMKDIEVISTGKETLNIIKTDNFITFKGTGKLQLFNKIKIDLKENVIQYKEYILPFEKKIIVEDADNGFKSKWKGYSWSYIYPKDIENIDLMDLENLTIKHVEFTIGQMEKDGRIYLKIKERIVKNGIKVEENQIPILF